MFLKSKKNLTNQIKTCLLWANLVLLLAISLFFIAYIVIVYFIADEWSTTINGLGLTLTHKIFMGIHMLLGGLLMLITPWQLFEKSRDWRLAIVHRWNGRVIITLSIITSIAGIAYVFAYGTVGGQFMSLAFATNGVIFSLISVMTLVMARQLIKPTNTSYTSTKELHRTMAFLVFAEVYSSLLYRILYVYASLLFDYQTPTPDHPELYLRPLDQSFQVLFFAIPIALALIVDQIIRHEKTKLLIAFLSVSLILQSIALINLFHSHQI